MTRVTRVIAHRGASSAAPENTIAAFRTAHRLGANMVELDVRRTADGALAVHHDAVLADGRAVVGVAAADLPPEVPLLAEALEACGDMGVNVEVKHRRGEPDFDEGRSVAELVVAALAGPRGRERLLLSAFDLVLADRLRTLDPTLATAWLVDEPAPGLVSTCRDHGHHALHPHDRLVDARLVDEAHAAGLAVHVWTVDDPARIAALAALGVDGVVTNVPDVARRALAGGGP